MCPCLQILAGKQTSPAACCDQIPFIIIAEYLRITELRGIRISSRIFNDRVSVIFCPGQTMILGIGDTLYLCTMTVMCKDGNQLGFPFLVIGEESCRIILIHNRRTGENITEIINRNRQRHLLPGNQILGLCMSPCLIVYPAYTRLLLKEHMPCLIAWIVDKSIGIIHKVCFRGEMELRTIRLLTQLCRTEHFINFDNCFHADIAFFQSQIDSACTGRKLQRRCFHIVFHRCSIL